MEKKRLIKKTIFGSGFFILLVLFNLLQSFGAEDDFMRKGKQKFRPKPNTPFERKPIPREMLYDPPVTIERIPTDLQFTPDPGVRVDFATLPNAGIDPETGVVHLYYNVTREHPTMRGGPMHATSKDGLNFKSGDPLRDPEHETRYPYDSRNTLLPDGNWRRYIFDPRKRYVTSYFSRDGINFTAEEGIRYELQGDDRGWMGVYTVFRNPLGDLVYLYLGNRHGLNNARIAYSEDGGETFEFKKGNIFGDANLGGGGQSFVDPASLILPDGRVRIITMRMCHIYTFISTDESCTTYAFEGLQMAPSDFTEFRVQGFFDPKLVLLPDGRMRFYVTAAIQDDNGTVRDTIVSATSKYD